MMEEDAHLIEGEYRRPHHHLSVATQVLSSSFFQPQAITSLFGSVGDNKYCREIPQLLGLLWS